LSDALDAPSARLRRWRAIGVMLPLGFAAGLPMVLVSGTLSYRLREAGVDRATIGFASWILLAYGFKWVWAPLVDQLPLPWLGRVLGRRRAWLLLSQLMIVAGLAGMALTEAASGLARLIGFAVFTAFASATQDIALDAYRIESAPADLQGTLAAAYQTGYRIAMIWAGAVALEIAQASGGADGYVPHAWTVAYLAMVASMALGIGAVMMAREAPPATVMSAPAPAPGWARRVRVALLDPFVDFVARYRSRALLILALVSCYRISDILIGVMANPFYVDLGFTKDEVARVSKIYGVAMTLIGAWAGGALVARFGVRRILPLAAAGSSASILLFALLAVRGHDLRLLILAVTADNLAGGVAGTTFIAFLSGLTSARFTGTQYALLTSVMALLPRVLAGFSGAAVDRFDYPLFFVGASLIGVPVVALAAAAARASQTDPPPGRGP
jgi:MFS transporter, PAT family, beta-lactamase induction signal transducer AmpG